MSNKTHQNNFEIDSPVVDVVLVCYNPNQLILLACLRSISLQVRKVVLVNNSAYTLEFLNEINNVYVIELGCNFGIAYAQNVGINYSVAINSDYILLSDQDTIYPKNYINNMLSTSGLKDTVCAGVAPMFIDMTANGDEAGFVVDSFLGFKTIHPECGVHDVFHVIASGFLIKAKVFSEVGLMLEELFIDWVDLEWCWRARSKGFIILGNADIKIEHQLGDMSRNIGLRKVPLRSPIRHYFITRNAFYLALYSKNIETKKKIALFIRSLKYIFGFPILSENKALNAKYMAYAFIHAVLKKLGCPGFVANIFYGFRRDNISSIDNKDK